MADSGRLNRAAGLPAVRFALVPRPEGGTRLAARTRKHGVALEWEEEAFEWVEPEWYAVVRRFARGPFALFRGGARLVPDGAGTQVTLHWAA